MSIAVIVPLFLMALRMFGNGSLGNVPTSFVRDLPFATPLIAVKATVLRHNA